MYIYKLDNHHYFHLTVVALFQTFTLTLVAIDPFMQVSEPVDLRLVSHLEPVFKQRADGTPLNIKKPLVFQVFSLPLFSFTGATSIVQKYNIQVRMCMKVHSHH